MGKKELLEGYGCIVVVLAFVFAASVSAAVGIAFGAAHGLLAFSAFTLTAAVIVLLAFVEESRRG